ncbi:MAG: DUF423 domain-containing protein [Burkholderiales bacterium]|nr:DUF423 domain-containing protein [Burkholderiales bacterium]
MSARAAIVAGALFAFVAVAAGAFGAHALRSRLAPDALAVWHTAAQYHGWHALSLLAAGLLLGQRPHARGAAWAAWSFAAGIVLFSGSLYALALTGVREFGAVTPFGGIAFLGGWGALAWAAWKSG